MHPGVSGRIVYSSPFVPAELIAAHGFVPERTIPRRRSAPPEGVCPFAQAFADSVGAGTGAAAAIFTTMCDQMRRAVETVRGRDAPPLFVLNVPHTWQTAGARRYYAAELDRLGRFLQGLGGVPTADADLARVMREHDDARRAGAASAAGGVTPGDGAAPVAVVGGPLSAGDRVLFDCIARAGGAVVLDATEHGERALPLPFDRRRLGGDPRGELAAAYFDGIVDAGRRPNTELYRWLKARLAARAVRGIVFAHYAWCDAWHAEAARMREWARLPFLCLELTGEAGAAAVLAHRVEAFVETVRCAP
ncbi:MAG TPA: hypothetical protein DCM87_05615 [Planctomycetes bacterium]|nr:hypothetical protein [Planctomycetota bacterium]